MPEKDRHIIKEKVVKYELVEINASDGPLSICETCVFKKSRCLEDCEGPANYWRVKKRGGK